MMQHQLPRQQASAATIPSTAISPRGVDHHHQARLRHFHPLMVHRRAIQGMKKVQCQQWTGRLSVSPAIDGHGLETGTVMSWRRCLLSRPQKNQVQRVLPVRLESQGRAACRPPIFRSGARSSLRCLPRCGERRLLAMACLSVCLRLQRWNRSRKRTRKKCPQSLRQWFQRAFAQTCHDGSVHACLRTIS